MLSYEKKYEKYKNKYLDAIKALLSSNKSNL